MTVPTWMTQCQECGWLLVELRDDPTRMKHAVLAGHLVEAHLGSLPGYVPGCSECDSWQRFAVDPVRSSRRWRHVLRRRERDPRAVPILVREDLRHRAEHVLTGM